MVEGTPGLPYGVDGQLFPSLCSIEENMRYRRQEVQNVLQGNEAVMSITSFPRLGCPGFTQPVYQPQPRTSASGSLFFPDEAIYGGHPRFKTLVRNIRARRKRKVIINLPIFRDTNTPNPFMEMFNDQESIRAIKPNHVYMDAMGFGMGCCCLQITFQATHIEEAKILYDQLAPITPIALALSAASPVYRGYLTDMDCRWNVISCAVDDRTAEESGEVTTIKESVVRIPKSRYDSISTYLSRQGQKFNDIPLVFDKSYYDIMIENKVEPAIARHIAHLFIRQPITLYKEKLEQTDEELDHFENIQSTNWQTMRFKPPPSVQSPIGWRVEFRPLEAQTTDFENAAYVVFITLLTRVILAYKLNFLMPLSLVDQNMAEAQKRDAVKSSKFWFRRDITRKSSSKGPLCTVLENCSNSSNPCNKHRSQQAVSSHEMTLSNRVAAHRVEHDGMRDMQSYATRMTIDEIINGCVGFIGIMPIICHYVDSFDDGTNTELITRIHKYLKFISDRASSNVKTTARFMRDYIDAHPQYNHDSIVNDEVNYDLLNLLNKIGTGEIVCPELTGDLQTATNGLDEQQHDRTGSGSSSSSAIVRKSTTLGGSLNFTRRSNQKQQKPQGFFSSRSVSR